MNGFSVASEAEMNIIQLVYIIVTVNVHFFQTFPCNLVTNRDPEEKLPTQLMELLINMESCANNCWSSTCLNNLSDNGRADRYRSVHKTSQQSLRRRI